MATQRNNLPAALEIAAKGYIPVAMLPGKKIPAESWKRRLQGPTTLESIYTRWQNTRNGIAIICQDIIVFDVDDENELDFVIESTRLHAAPLCRTPRGGFHVHGRCRDGVSLAKKTKVNGRPVDVLTGIALSIVPTSVNAHGIPYEWLGAGLPPIGDLPVAEVGWIHDRPPPVPAPPIEDAGTSVRRARAYLARIEGAIAGQRGHDRTMRVAGILIQKFGLTIEQAWPLILEWNHQCKPPWHERELRHKLADALRLRSHFRKEGF